MSTSAPTRIPETDTLGKCEDWCADSYNVSMFSMLSETCTCHNDSYQSYITLPENYCDWPCYREEPFEMIPTCGARPRLHRSFYVTGECASLMLMLLLVVVVIMMRMLMVMVMMVINRKICNSVLKVHIPGIL